MLLSSLLKNKSDTLKTNKFIVDFDLRLLFFSLICIASCFWKGLQFKCLTFIFSSYNMAYLDTQSNSVHITSNIYLSNDFIFDKLIWIASFITRGYISRFFSFKCLKASKYLKKKILWYRIEEEIEINKKRE